MANDNKKPRVFICYAKEDYKKAEEIFEFLSKVGADPWLDKKSLRLGDLWEPEIEREIAQADAFVVCLRPGFDEIGVRQVEVRHAIKALERRPLDRGFIIPFVLEPCELPEWCRRFHAGGDPTGPTQLTELRAAIEKHCRCELGALPVVENVPWKVTDQVSFAVVGPGQTRGVMFSPEAWTVAAYLVNGSPLGLEDDFQPLLTDVMEEAGLPEEAARKGVNELKREGLVDTSNVDPGFFRVRARTRLFVEADNGAKGWDPKEDARTLLRLAAKDLQHGVRLQDIANELGWEPRRVNPAAAYLVSEGYAEAMDAPIGYDYAYSTLRKLVDMP